jgi:tetrahydromethanopterin S-methyltransferase subunit G
MINEGFKTTASKEDIKAVTTRLDRIDSRLDRIEHLLLPSRSGRLKT